MIDLETGRKIINKLLQQPLVKGINCRYLISVNWFIRWKEHVNRNSHPGYIDNSSLLRGTGSAALVRDDMIVNRDYVLIPEEGWKLLVAWYGVPNKRTPIKQRFVLCDIDLVYAYPPEIEVKLYYFLFLPFDRPNTFRPGWLFDNSEIVGHLELFARNKYNLGAEREVRLWGEGKPRTLIPSSDTTVGNSGLSDGQTIIVEYRRKGESWPLREDGQKLSESENRPKGTSNDGTGMVTKRAAGTTLMEREDKSDALPPVIPVSPSPVPRPALQSRRFGLDTDPASVHLPPVGRARAAHRARSLLTLSGRTATPAAGVCGLTNLGNTCFANSALQCFSNTPLARKHFQLYGDDVDDWENENGRRSTTTVEALAELLGRMWSGSQEVASAKRLMRTLQDVVPSLVDGRQHDSVEFLCALLNHLHDDLNRVSVRLPRVPLPEMDKMTDKEIARLLWARYKERDDSVVVDHFFFQLKSTVICLRCDKRSVSFDPLNTLTLPIPPRKDLVVDLVLVRDGNASELIKCRVPVASNCTVEDLCEELRHHTGIAKEKMLITEHEKLSPGKYKKFSPCDFVDNFMDGANIVVYELPNEEMIRIPVIVRKESKTLGGLHSTIDLESVVVQLPGTSCSYDQLYEAILKRAKQFSLLVRCNQTSLNGYRQGTMNNHWSWGNSSASRQSIELDTYSYDSRSSPNFTIHSIRKYSTFETEIRDNGTPVFISDISCLIINEKSDSGICFNMDTFKKFSVPYRRKKSTKSRDKLTLNDCVEHLLAEQTIGRSSTWICDRCQHEQIASKKLDLWTLPSVLIVHLKRFTLGLSSASKKIETFVDFPHSWTISRNGSDPVDYDLQAVSNHHGSGLFSGHYTAFGKNPNGMWYKFDDSHVQKVDESSVVTPDAYMLIYQSRDAWNQIKREDLGAKHKRPSSDQGGGSQNQKTGSQKRHYDPIHGSQV